jgi:2-iminobutanoate/2-iminopropanoate deaminase
VPRIPLQNPLLPAPVGYSRAVRATGTETIYTSMTAPVGPDGAVVAPDDAYRQTLRIVENIGDILRQNGSSLDDVVQLTAFITRQENIAAVQRGIGESFSPPPAISVALVGGLPNPSFLVEIAAVAVS